MPAFHQLSRAACACAALIALAAPAPTRAQQPAAPDAATSASRPAPPAAEPADTAAPAPPVAETPPAAAVPAEPPAPVPVAVPTPPVAPAATPLLDAAEPPADGKDWVQLTNGEWMMGALNSMRDGSVEFDSDEFDIHAVDFADVKRMFLRTPMEVGLVSLDDLSGPVEIVDDRVVVHTDAGVRELTRADVLSIVPAAEWELDYWSLDASLGVNLARGNSNQTTLSASSAIVREDSLTKLRLGYLGNYGKSAGTENTKNHRGETRFDLFVSPVFYITPANATFEYDEFKNLRIRATPGAGVGAHLVNKPAVAWDVGLLGAYQYVQFLSVQPGRDIDAHNGAVSLGTTLDVDFTEDVELYLEYINTLVVTELGLTTHHAVGQLEVDITTVFNVAIKAIFDRTEQPVTDAQGNTPKQNDVQLIASLGIELG